jgi:hypothetical protein
MRTNSLFLLSVVVAFAACAEDDACDAGMKKANDGTCVADTAGSGSSSGNGGSGGSGGSSSGNAGAPATSEDFGAICTTHADCHGDTSYCAMPPGVPHYCTAPGCDVQPDLCPAQWICFDVSQVVAGEPWICAPPL